jgi:hypothetical protein
VRAHRDLDALSEAVDNMRRSLIAVPLLLAACARDLTAPATDLLVTASASRDSFRVGDTVTVRVTVFNRSGQPQTIGGGGCGFLGFQVTTPSGAMVGPSSAFCSAELVLKTLGPGDQYSEDEVWTGSAIGNGAGTALQMLSPGSYVVTGDVDPLSAQGSAEAPRAIEYVAAKVTITP